MEFSSDIKTFLTNYQRESGLIDWYYRYFTAGSGQKILFEVFAIANSREDAPEKRTFHEKYTLKAREYGYDDKYYLVLADTKNEKIFVAVWVRDWYCACR